MCSLVRAYIGNGIERLWLRAVTITRPTTRFWPFAALGSIEISTFRISAYRVKPVAHETKTIYATVSKLCTTTRYLLAFTTIYWHIQIRQTPQAT